MEDSYSTFFSFKELTDSKGHPNLVAQNRIEAEKYALAGKRLSKLLESIRHILGDQPLKVNSGFRSRALNSAVGSRADGKFGRNLSKHCIFEACDIKPSGMGIKEAFTALMNAQRGGLLPDLRKVIREDHKGIIHVEVKMNTQEASSFYTTNDNINFTKVMA